MRVDDLFQDLSWALYVLVFVLVAVRAARRPTRAHLDMALLFGAAALIIVLTGVAAAMYPTNPPALLGQVSGGLVMAMPYLLLRLVSDFASVPAWLLRVSEAGVVASVLALVLLPAPLGPVPVVLLVAYFVAVIVYDTWAFGRAAQRGRGVTRRRMQAVAIGSACLGVVLLVAGVAAVIPSWAEPLGTLGQVASLASGLCYFVGFVPPTWLRRAWQEPELRDFLGRAARLPRLPDTRDIIRELERGAADALGAGGASLGTWDADSGVLRFYGNGNGVVQVDPQTRPVAGRALLEQRALLFRDLKRADPSNAELYRAYDSRSALVAPVTAGDKRVGVLVVYHPREPVFANSDLELLQLLADQAAVILESRALIDEAASLRAREEAARLKEDFLSSAAHDLKTPLTGMLSQAQLLQRRAQRNAGEAIDEVGLERLVREGRRLKALVLELLDASEQESVAHVSTTEAVDLVAIAREVCGHQRPERRHCVVWASEPVVGHFDPVRVRQLMEQLVDNAIKFSTDEPEVNVRVWREEDLARIAVIDRGIGIPPHDLPWLFQRFHRGTNVDDRRFAGLGLGLHISRQIVEQHGGRMWAESKLGQGSAFHVELPLRPAVERAQDAPGEVAGA